MKKVQNIYFVCYRNQYLDKEQHQDLIIRNENFDIVTLLELYAMGDISPECKIVLPRNVTTIIKDLNPRLENYLNKLLRFIPMQVRQVHESSTYEPAVFRIEAWRYMGVFYDYLIRKEIHNLLEIEATDNRASRFEEQLNEYEELLNCIKKELVSDDAGGPSCDLLHDKAKKVADTFFPIDSEKLIKPVASYQKYKDPKNATLDIIEDIFNTSMFHCHWFGDPMIPFNPELVNMNNVKNVIKYIGTLDKNNISLNPDLDCEYFNGDADLILDDVLLEIKVSMNPLKIKHIKCRRHLYQLILYALGVFVNEGKEIRKFKIYNPLLGIMYFFEIAHLNFTEFLELVDEIKPL